MSANKYTLQKMKTESHRQILRQTPAVLRIFPRNSRYFISYKVEKNSLSRKIRSAIMEKKQKKSVKYKIRS